jgi:protocatechuate 3,4-dioxygenase beta subunit
VTPRPYNREAPGTQPANAYPGYGSTAQRAPQRAPFALAQTLTEITGPTFASGWAGRDRTDLTRGPSGEAIGERIIVTGRVVDEDGVAVPSTLVEVWQANAAGRYRHAGDEHDAPLDPNFSGVGQFLTGPDGSYRFVTIRPGAYPWSNHSNAWRPAHIHISVFGPGFATRLVTQMYFPGDPLQPLDPIFNSVPDAAARARLVAAYAHDVTVEGRALGFRFDIVLRGHAATPEHP